MIKKFLILFFILSHNSHAKENFGYQFCNQHPFTFLWMKVYDSYLCLDDRQFLYPEKIYQTDFSLVINYNMNFTAKELATSSIEEMNRYYSISQTRQQDYFNRLLSIFPNVKKSDIIEARYSKDGTVDFYHNNIRTGTIKEGQFARHFLDIWLYGNNKYQQMTKDLFKK